MLKRFMFSLLATKNLVKSNMKARGYSNDFNALS